MHRDSIILVIKASVLIRKANKYLDTAAVNLLVGKKKKKKKKKEEEGDGDDEEEVLQRDVDVFKKIRKKSMFNAANVSVHK